MKRIVKQLMLLAALASLAGCKDFLTEKPTEKLFSTQVYANRATAYTAVIGCYSMFPTSNYYGAAWTETLAPSSVFVSTGLDIAGNLGATQGEIVKMATYSYDANMNGISTAWSGVYQAISRCNNTIYGVEHSAGISPEDKDKLIGEVRFLRAVSYFNVVRMWGRAPLPLTPPTSIAEVHRPRVGVDTIFNAIIEDLKFAEEHMPTKAEQSWGKPYNYAASAFLAKVYISMATSEYMFLDRAVDPWAGQRDGFWQTAYDYAKKVYDASEAGQAYSLMPNYYDLWMGRNKSTPESIFEIQFDPSTGQNGWAWGTYVGHSMYAPHSTTNNNSGRVVGTRPVWDWQVAKYTLADPRMGANYITDGYYLANPQFTGAGNLNGKVYIFPTDTIPDITPVTRVTNWGVTLPRFKKYIWPLWQSGNQANVNWIIYRYSDLLLTLAEAANETGRHDEAVGYVNKVLTRARNSYDPGHPLLDINIFPPHPSTPSAQPANWDPTDPAISTQDGLREAIMKERLFEMPHEGNEWFDVRRRGIVWFQHMAIQYNYDLTSKPPRAADVTTAGVSRIQAMLIPMDDNTVRKILFMPIPVDEINSNWAYATNRDQNFGY